MAHFSTFSAITALARAHDCDLYLPGGKAFDPRLQNRRLDWELLALLWLGQQEGAQAKWRFPEFGAVAAQVRTASHLPA